MYEYALYEVSEWPVMLAQLGKQGKEGWKVSIALSPTVLLLERQYEPVQSAKSTPVRAAKPTPVPPHDITQTQRNQLIQDVFDDLKVGDADELRTVFSTVRQVLFHVERRGFMIVPPPKS